MALEPVSTSGGGYTYVQDVEPSDPSEGEEWYDTGADAAFVYDGTSWIEQTVVDHGQLSGVSSGDHHSRPTSTNNSGQVGDTESVFNGNYNSGNKSTQVGIQADRIYVELRNTDSSRTPEYNGTIYYWGGGTDSWSVSLGTNDTHTEYFYPDKHVKNIDHGCTDTVYSSEATIDVTEMTLAQHSHNL